jgi:hypothetical protein
MTNKATLPGYMTAREAAKRMGYHPTYFLSVLKDPSRDVPGAVKAGGTWWVPNYVTREVLQGKDLMAKPVRERIEGARIVRRDIPNAIVLAWFGGHGVHAYDAHGTEIAFWNVGDFEQEDADEEDVRQSMREHILAQDYDDFS